MLFFVLFPRYIYAARGKRGPTHAEATPRLGTASGKEKGTHPASGWPGFVDKNYTRVKKSRPGDVTVIINFLKDFAQKLK